MFRRWREAGKIKLFFLIPLSVFVFSTFIGYFSVILVLDKANKNVLAEFEREGDNTQEFATSKTDEYQQALYDAKVLFSVNSDLGRAEFGKHENNAVIRQSYQGLSMMGYAKRVSVSDSSSFILSVRSDRSLNSEGYPDYKITPTKSSGSYLPITYLEPYNKEMMGTDLSSNSIIEAVIEESIESGQPAMTDKLRLYGDRDGFIMLDLIYANGADISTANARSSAMVGAIFAGYKSYDIFPALLEKSTVDPSIGIQIYSGESTEDEHLLYSAMDPCEKSCTNDYKNPLTFVSLPVSASGSKLIDVMNVKWTVKLTASDQYVANHIGKWPAVTAIIALIGIISLSIAAGLISAKRFGVKSASNG